MRYEENPRAAIAVGVLLLGGLGVFLAVRGRKKAKTATGPTGPVVTLAQSNVADWTTTYTRQSDFDICMAESAEQIASIEAEMAALDCDADDYDCIQEYEMWDSELYYLCRDGD